MWQNLFKIFSIISDTLDFKVLEKSNNSNIGNNHEIAGDDDILQISEDE